eukprot:TRINITY_DN31519_c0_g1_i1.p1 TRINITY_DN31519_c0_g1~~TRINITY_DN31519_c0_g1_i1.p1  ORF type:complete len:602 (-),score=176.07 TRINITY_DN31519_c0_g1_i1:245-2050(-)
MGKRRLAHVASSSDEEDNVVRPRSRARVTASPSHKAKEKEGKERENEKAKQKEKQTEAAVEDSEEQEDESGPDLRPLGDVVRKSGRGRYEKKHYAAFELDGNRYELEDPVLVTPEEKNEKPYVAIIKDIKQSRDGSLAVQGQWFYRPEEAEKKGGGSWQSRDARELFYSFHHDEVPAESVMHKCVAHFIPPNKQLPLRTKHPGFIVQKVYDTVEKKLWNLTDKDYEDSKQKEIDLLVQKTRNALGELPDIVTEDAPVESDELEKNKRQLRRKALAPISTQKDEDGVVKSESFGRTETPGSANFDGHGTNLSELSMILLAHNATTGVKLRDRWLERILQGVKHVCNSSDNGKDSNLEDESQEKMKAVDHSSDSKETTKKDKVESFLVWPHAAIPAVCALEKAAHESLGNDNHKYNMKMRQLDFNLKSNAVLARRLLKKELDASTVLNMSPAELKDGLTAEEKNAQEPQEVQTVQMADVRCSICSEKKVRVRDIIHVGYGDRYQLECLGCGHSWYSSRDSISSLTIETISPASTVGTVPSATVKFDEAEKMRSPRESDKMTASGPAQKETSSEDVKGAGDIAAAKPETKTEENRSHRVPEDQR